MHTLLDMTGERDERQAGTTSEGGEQGRTEEREAPAAGMAPEPARVPAPSPEEAPELLGEHADYPIAWDGEDT
jgi:hypothetical protein